MGCSKYPTCKWIQSLPEYIEDIQKAESQCEKCGGEVMRVKAKREARINQLIMRIRFSETD